MNITELISKYLQKTSTVEENIVLMEWVINSEENTKEFASICRYWYASGRKQEEKKFNSHTAFAKFKKIISNKNQQTKKVHVLASYWKQISAVAAVVILFASSFLLFNKNTTSHTIANTNQAVLEVVLPDSSMVFLHQNAQISYPSKFNSKSRDIHVQGHVFCDVQTNQNQPFLVTTPTITIQVLGTKFDIKESQNTASVIVAEGSVKVTSNATQTHVVLNENERADISVDEDIVATINSDINFLSWKTGILTFNRTPLLTVFSDIERQYNCSIIVSDKDIYSEILTGTYQNHKLEEILEVIAAAFPNLSYTQVNNTISFQNKTQ